jgi:hypothetical protein
MKVISDIDLESFYDQMTTPIVLPKDDVQTISNQPVRILSD